MGTKININQRVTVILQQRGVEALAKHYEQHGMEPRLHEVGENFTAQMWTVMEIFGPYINMALESPFETEIIVHEF